jgi:pimeloyl-ACP methyl ester carboxylesterase
MRRATACALASVVALGAAGLLEAERPADDRPQDGSVRLEACDIPGVEGKARCGVLEVWEDRETRKGRRIGLRIVMLPATGTPRLLDPLVFLSGGPGEAATEEAPGLAAELARIREHRDLLLVDQRGTGGSHPLNCDMYLPANELQSYLGKFFPPESVRRCRSELEKNADLTLYTTPIAMDDLDEVREALGYDRINLIGGSYGTRAAQVYLRRHPSRLRTVVLHGVVPTDDRMPLHIPRYTERALTGILEGCAAEAACHAAFPNLREESRAIVATLHRSPVRVTVLNPSTGDPTEVSLSRDLAVEAIRYMLYSPATAREVPVVIHQAAGGDWEPLAERALFFRREIVGGGSNGLYLSITCAEDVPWIRPGEGEREAKGTFLGDYRLKQQRAACALWPRGVVSKDYLQPVRESAPVLLLTGQWDPATPPSSADAVASHLSHSLHVVVPHGGHAFDGLLGLACVQDLVRTFIERGVLDGLDTGCVATIRRPPFRLEPLQMKIVALDPKDLARLAGSYIEEGGPLETTYTVKGGKLVASVPGQQFLLVPVSPTRFRIPEDPMAAVTFDLEEGRVRRVVVTEGDTPVRKFVPKKS